MITKSNALKQSMISLTMGREIEILTKIKSSIGNGGIETLCSLEHILLGAY